MRSSSEVVSEGRVVSEGSKISNAFLVFFLHSSRQRVSSHITPELSHWCPPSSRDLHLEHSRRSQGDRRSRVPRVVASKTVDQGAATDTVLAHSWMERRKDDAPRKVVRHTRGQKSVGRMFTQRVGNWTATAPADGVMFVDQLRSPALTAQQIRKSRLYRFLQPCHDTFDRPEEGSGA